MAVHAASGFDHLRSEHDQLHGPDDGVNDRLDAALAIFGIYPVLLDDRQLLTDRQQGLDLGDLQSLIRRQVVVTQIDLVHVAESIAPKVVTHSRPLGYEDKQ